MCATCRYDFAIGGVRRKETLYEGKTSGYAIASFVCGLICLFCGGLPLGIVALVLGEVAHKQIARDTGMSGKGMATAGRILGIIGIIGGVVILALYYFSG